MGPAFQHENIHGLVIKNKAITKPNDAEISFYQASSFASPLSPKNLFMGLLGSVQPG